MKTLRCDIADGIATVTLDRPPRNSMTLLMLEEAYELLGNLSREPSLQVVVLTGAGGPGHGFCPGTDIDEVDEAIAARFDPRPFDVSVLLHEMPQVTVAAINGSAAGSGLGWACACDFRLAAASARFNMAFLSRGVAGDMGGPWTLQRIVGAAKAREICLLPGKIDAAEALRIGLVTRVFADDEFAAGVDDIVSRLAHSAPLAIRALKSNFLAAERMSFADYVRSEAETHGRLLVSADADEGFKSYLERREPQWLGR